MPNQMYAILPTTGLAWPGPNPCPGCRGLGVTGERYEMPETTPVLLVDVFCPDCGGCGSADPEHRGCDPKAHADPEDLGLLADDDWDDLDDEDGPREPPCPSCGGRRWNAVQAFSGDTSSADWESVEMKVLKVPCGCAEDLMVTGTDRATLAPYPETEWTAAEAGQAVAAALDQLDQEPGPWRHLSDSPLDRLRRLEDLDDWEEH